MSSHEQPCGDESREIVAEMRVDAAHPLKPSNMLSLARGGGAAVSVGAQAESNESAAVGARVERSLEQLREHAAQLADRLQSEQSTLDRRERAIAAQEADLEAKWENARQWMGERQVELDQRAEALAAREQELVEREALAEDRATQLTQVRFEALAEREARVDAREAELQRMNSEVASRLAALDEDRAEWNERHQQLEARELATEARHREIDQRQAQLYREIEQFSLQKATEEQRLVEIERRETKVADWESLLQAQAAQLEKQMDGLRQRAGELEMERAELRKATADLDARKTELDAAERQLAFREQEIKTALQRYERLGVTEERMQQLQEEARKFAARRRYLDEAESQLTKEKEELADRVREFANQRRQWEEHTVRERRAIVAQEQLAEQDRKHRASQLDQREAELDARENALAQMQAELRATQREVLEMRLATEETWAQLSGALAPASLTRSISQVRAKLADHYRATIQDIESRSQQLEAVRHDLAQQLGAIEEQRQELGAWAERRHADIEEQAARLVAREQELDRQQEHYEQMESQWSLERTDYQAEIRRLLASIRDLETEELRAA